MQNFYQKFQQRAKSSRSHIFTQCNSLNLALDSNANTNTKYKYKYKYRYKLKYPYKCTYSNTSIYSDMLVNAILIAVCNHAEKCG